MKVELRIRADGAIGGFTVESETLAEAAALQQLSRAKYGLYKCSSGVDCDSRMQNITIGRLPYRLIPKKKKHRDKKGKTE